MVCFPLVDAFTAVACWISPDACFLWRMTNFSMNLQLSFSLESQELKLEQAHCRTIYLHRWHFNQVFLISLENHKGLDLDILLMTY